MIAETKINDRIEFTKDMAQAGYIPDAGPALLSDKESYEKRVNDRLVGLKAERIVGDEAEKIYVENETNRNKKPSQKQKRVATGMAIIVAATTLAGPGGMAKDAYIGVKSFPDHVAYLYDRYVDNQSDNGYSYPTIPG